MKAHTNYIFFFLFIIHSLIPASGFSFKKTDTSSVHTRSFDKEKLTSYQKSKKFQYDRKRVDLGEGASNWFWNWINKFLRKIGYYDNEWKIIKIILYVIAGAAITLLIIMLFKVDLRGLWSGKSSSKIKIEYVEENIHEMDFEKLIQSAIEEKDYRKAVRLFYLSTLKKLADKNIIDWQPGKTNYDYLLEIKTQSIQPIFKELNYFFQYVWYGDFPVDIDNFQTAQLSYQQAIKEIEKL